MKNLPLFHFLTFLGRIILLGLIAVPVFAQDTEKMQELQRIIDVQQKQMETQQKQLDAQKQLLQDLQKQMESLVKDTDTEGAPVAAEKSAAKSKVTSTKAPPPDKKVVPRVVGNGSSLPSQGGSTVP
jgi:predicted Holliday junction resolvase-like endonuclease